MLARKIEEFRRKAEECLQRAAQATRSEDNVMFLEMAQQWLMLAQGVERRWPQVPKPDNDTSDRRPVALAT